MLYSLYSCLEAGSAGGQGQVHGGESVGLAKGPRFVLGESLTLVFAPNAEGITP